MASLRPDSVLRPAGIFRTAPFPGETASSLLSRLAHRHSLGEKLCVVPAVAQLPTPAGERGHASQRRHAAERGGTATLSRIPEAGDIEG